MIRRLRHLLGFVFMLPALAAANEPVRLSLPVDCEPGRTCWVSKLMDHDGGDRDIDWRCGLRAAGNHNGTDIAVADMATAAATRVLAAAPGVVLGVRDGMPDVNVLETGLAAVAGKECGNGLVIDHGQGLRTQYCHMHRGSLTVAAGQRVDRGQELGRIGLSGASELPHLHLSVLRGGAPVDPFTGAGVDGLCGVPGDAAAALWTPEALAALPYQARLLYRVGLTGGTQANLLAARSGAYDTAPAIDAPALLVWFDSFARRMGDRMRIRILGPGGEIFRHEEIVQRDSTQWFSFVGLRRKQPRWPSGDYVAEVEWLPVEGGDPLRRSMTVRID